MKIITISEQHPLDFDNKVNKLLKNGWELHGTSTVQTVSRHDTWNGKPYSIPETTYTQVLKRNS